MDENAISKRIDPKTGKLIIEGTIKQELDFEVYHNRLAQLENEVSNRKANIEKHAEELKTLQDAHWTKQLQELNEKIELIAKIKKRESVEKTLVSLQTEQFKLEKELGEQKKLDEDYVKFKK